MENTDQPSLTDVLTTRPPLKKDAVSEMFKPSCPKCGKEFASMVAVRMHDMRVHTKKLGDGFKWKAGIRYRGNKPMIPQTREERLAKKREYNRKYRARKGKVPRPETWKEDVDGRAKGGNKGMKLPGWSLARRRKFLKTMREKAIQDAALKTKKKLRYVYPAPTATTPTTGIDDPFEPFTAVKPTNIRKVRFCPFCGEQIEKHLYETP